MAWITPVTDRVAGSRTTATDMNRIANNLTEVGAILEKTTYTSNDIVTATDWNQILSVAKSVDSTITDSTDYVNLNKIEAAIATARTLSHFYIRKDNVDYVQFYSGNTTYSQWITSSYNSGLILPKSNSRQVVSWSDYSSSACYKRRPTKSAATDIFNANIVSALATAHASMPANSLSELGVSSAVNKVSSMYYAYTYTASVRIFKTGISIQNGDIIAIDDSNNTYLDTCLFAFKGAMIDLENTAGSDTRTYDTNYWVHKVTE